MDKEFIAKKKGFTLVEILVVLGIIGIIVFVGLSSYGVVRKKMQLDIAATTVQSMIAEAREKARAGYFEEGGDDTTSATYCFGFNVEIDGFIKLMQTPFNRISENKKCFADTEPRIIKVGTNEGDIIVKNIQMFGQDVQSNYFEAFFLPPYAEIELEQDQSLGLENHEVRIIVGRSDSILSEKPLDHREIILDVLSGSVKAKRYDPEQDVESLFN
ncbi:Tfp pilus assembly protein FimT/FimU [Patescibacteria group bacterium]